VTSAGIAALSFATLFSLTSVCTSSSARSAMVAIAPPSRDAWPCTPNGETVSPTSARFLITTPSNGARTFAFSIASSVTRTRARADAMAASADFTRAGGHRRRGFGGGQRRGGGDAILHQRALPLQVAQVLVPRRDRLPELRLAFRDGAPRRLELRVDIRVLDLGNHLALAHAGPLFEPEARQPAAHLDADVAAATRDHVAARHQYRQRRRTARRRHRPCVTRAVSTSGRAPLGDVGAGIRVEGCTRRPPARGGRPTAASAGAGRCPGRCAGATSRRQENQCELSRESGRESVSVVGRSLSRP
jgi:hypothetical protein